MYVVREINTILDTVYQYHNSIEILLKVALNTNNTNPTSLYSSLPLIWFYKRDNIEGDKLLVFNYRYLSASEIWPDKKGG
jgi:hypothetical protein